MQFWSKYCHLKIVFFTDSVKDEGLFERGSKKLDRKQLNLRLAFKTFLNHFVQNKKLVKFHLNHLILGSVSLSRKDTCHKVILDIMVEVNHGQGYQPLKSFLLSKISPVWPEVSGQWTLLQPCLPSDICLQSSILSKLKSVLKTIDKCNPFAISSCHLCKQRYIQIN